jgi:2-polyprenyl-6-hydroxyphenyl methylase / 3-demethylubiquinone-9 3-methyltransferase
MGASHTQAGNVDPGEIAKFEALASALVGPDSEFKPLHDINPLRLDFIDARAGLAGKRVVDVGCGGGLLAEAMAHRGAEVTGIDLGEAPLAVARLHAEESGSRSTIAMPAWRRWPRKHPAASTW